MTAWDVTTAEYSTRSFAITEDSDPQGICFSANGRKMYVAGNANNRIYQYTLSYPWRISTAVYASISFDVSSETDKPRGVFLSTDGTKMFVSGDNFADPRVYEYDLATPFDISTASYSGNDSGTLSFIVNHDLAFNTAGDKMYLSGSTSFNLVLYYDLGTPWDISTLSLNDSAYISTDGSSYFYGGVFVSSDGATLYTCESVDSAETRVAQWTIPGSWPSDMSSTSFYDVFAEAVQGESLRFSSDGKKFYVFDHSTNTVYQYNLVPEASQSGRTWVIG